MKKIKRIWQENKVLLVLAIILIICIVVFCVVAITYFYGSSSNPLGNRADITNEMPLKDKLLDDIKNELEKDEKVKVASVTKSPTTTVYIDINYVDGTKMADAKKIAEKVIELFSEEELSVYDIEFTINTLSTSKVDGYTLKGARNANGSGTVIWGNYNIKEESSESK